ncbi:GGDEF domain-containing protein [Sulfurospirillum arcachonense]|uniref:GGDEF domain-containing protein n=1 Tax=Sulfurospirillum arcachonense TaxID=57666 RepID=UPI0004697FFD|nr:GGDEF domain-containing protein [Sulfurospirillum arcachonense]
MFTLKYFDKNKENLFSLSIKEVRQKQMMYLSNITAFFYILYIGIDFLILPTTQLYYAITLHSLITFFLILSSLSFLSNKLNHLAKYIIILPVLTAATGSFMLTKIGIFYYIDEIYVIVVWVFTLIGFKFLESLIINNVIVISHISLILFFKTLTYEATVVHMFILCASFTMSLVGGYIMEFYARSNFENQLNILDMQEELKKQANHDYLTNLYNRRYFNEIAQNLIKIENRENKPLSIIMIDIDNFKYINDTYGHTIGDDVIKLLAFLLKKHTRDSDITARYGGEEFVILLPSTNQNGAIKIAEHIRTTVENQNISINTDKYINFTISLGVSSLNHKNELISEILNRADKALYSAKENGKNKTEVSY